MAAFTSKVFQASRAPKRIALLGNKARPESAQHVIEFPGGAVEVSRTSNGDYWAHIIVNRRPPVEDAEGLVSAVGEVIEGRVGRSHPGGVSGIEAPADIEQIAVLIRRAA